MRRHRVHLSCRRSHHNRPSPSASASEKPRCPQALSILLQSKCVTSFPNMKKAPIGRVIPVVLAILFMGGAEHALQAANAAGGQSSRLAFESLATSRAVSTSGRTALCLLPAFLNHACQTASHAPSAAYADIGSGGLLAGFVGETPARTPTQLTHVARVCQRPPPAA